MSAPVAHIDPVYLGLRVYEWLTLAGVVLAPIIAVCVTLWIENRRRTRDQQIQIMRMLLSTRHLPSDAAYSVAINSIPVEFDQSAAIMVAWRAYLETARFTPSAENAARHFDDIRAKQTRLIFEVTKFLGFSITEGEIANAAYAADGMITRDNITIDAWRAWPRIAAALEESNRIITGQSDQKGSEK